MSPPRRPQRVAPMADLLPNRVSDQQTLAEHNARAACYADDWHNQPEPADLHAVIRQFFTPGPTADIGCGSGREVAWLNANGYPAVGYDAAEGMLAVARERYPQFSFRLAALPDLAGIPDESFDNVLCETVIMHLPREQIAPAVRRLTAILKPAGILYASWRVTAGADDVGTGSLTLLAIGQLPQFGLG